jgi:demethylmenaquinone methyltransferase / 2-methoxy-6-polyprenyl-1,4-benzoquinol methylase
MAALNQSRDQTVRSMFDRIAGRYDLLNRIISLSLDHWWRRQVIRAAVAGNEPFILDIGTGTGDLVLHAAKSMKGKGRFIGLDFSLPMLNLARVKQAHASYGATTRFVMGSAMSAPFRDARFDSAMAAFVLRNVSDLPLLFTETMRVLKPGGKFVSVDMFPPSTKWFATLYSIYFYSLVPHIGGFLAHDRSAYQYLSDSVRNFHPPETITQLLREAGFEQVTLRKFLNGAVCMHIAKKPSRI